ncbi:MAG: hypothetical protein IJE89_02855 [Bacilli bacterium]|nr:hypothetical protein [Bacilli bacterium]
MKRKITLFIFVIILLMSNLEKYEAKTMQFNSISNSSGGGGNQSGNPDDCTPQNNCDGGSVTEGDTEYSYEYTKIIETQTKISVDVYDMEGNSLIPEKRDQTTEHFFKAGTWIGINTTEIHSADWSVSNFKFYLPYKKYTCHYKKTTKEQRMRVTTTNTGTECDKIVANDKGTILNKIEGANGWVCQYTITKSSTSSTTKNIVIKPSANVDTECKNNRPNGYSKGDYKDATPKGVDNTQREEVTDKVSDTIKDKAKNEAREKTYGEAKGKVSYSNAAVTYITTNRYPLEVGTDTKTIDYSAANNYTLDTYKESGRDSGATSGKLRREYEILEKNVCMNMKTSEVFYGRECKESEGEIKIENGTVNVRDENKEKEVNYWHYFIPLNIKSNSAPHPKGNTKEYTEEFENEINRNQVFYLSIVKNENKEYSFDTCKDYMTNENPEYYHYEIIAKGETGDIPFTGNYYNDLLILEQAGSCNSYVQLYFPISQEFYKEVTKEDSTISLKGFNFYYRPIDINDPFPNGIGASSLWNLWSKNTEKNPDISKSFTTITYQTEKINADKIREYTKENPYTSWTNMNLDGTSSYIGSGNNFIIQRKTSGNIYKLGCGPANKNKFHCGGSS